MKEHVRATYTFENPRVQLIINGQDLRTDSDSVEQDLATHVLVEMTKKGRVTSLNFASENKELSQGFTKTLVSILQFVVPDNRLPTLTQWDTHEEDPNGLYVARYRTMTPLAKNPSDKNAVVPITVRKTKLRYLTKDIEPKHGEIPIRRTIMPSGSLTMIFDQLGGHVLGVDGTISEQTTINGKKVAHSSAKLNLKYVRTSTIDPPALEALQRIYGFRALASAGMPLSARLSEEQAEAAIQRAELKDANADTLLAELAKAEATPSTEVETSLYLKFKALVYLQPSVSPQLGERLKTASSKGITMRLLSGVLGGIGHEQAQQALIMALQDRRNRPADLNAFFVLLSAFGNVPGPIPQAEEAVRSLEQAQLHPEISALCEFTLGSMARNLEPKAPVRSSHIVESLLAKLHATSSHDRSRHLLLALGNSGSSMALPALEDFISHESSLLRAAATSSLRWIKGKRAERLLLERLSGDRAPDVRAEAAIALSFRPATPAIVEAQRKAMMSDTSIKVRENVLTNLWNARVEYPQVKEFVGWAASKDPAKNVREMAQNIIETHPEEFPKSRNDTLKRPI